MRERLPVDGTGQPDGAALTREARTVIEAISRQLDEEISMEDLRAETRLRDDHLLAVLGSLRDAGWIVRRALGPFWMRFLASDEAARWSMTPEGHREATRLGLLDEPELRRTDDGGMLLQPRRRKLRYWYVGTVRLTPTSVLVKNWHGGMRIVPRGSIERIAIVTVWWGGRNPAFDYMLFVGAAGRCLARATVDGISSGSQQAFANELKVPISDQRWPWISPKQLRKQFPGSMSWSAAHPELVVTAAVLLTLAAIVLTLAAIFSVVY